MFKLLKVVSLDKILYNINGDKMETYVKGIFKRSIFSTDKGYIVGIMKVKETNDKEIEMYIDKTISFTGYFHELEVDEMYKFVGESTIHPKYGFQYSVSSYERIKPSDKEGIILFLSSDLFKGIGEKMATKIVEKLGNNAIDRIISEENALDSIKGLTKEKKLMIIDTLKKYEESNTMIVYLTDLGFSVKESLIIYNTYKSNTINIIDHNIYSILDEIEDISFLKIDKIALKMGIDKDFNERIKASILYTLKNRSFNTGDTYFTKEEIIESLYSYLKYEIDNIDEYLYELREEDKLVKEGEDYYLTSIYDSERCVLHKVTTLLRKEPKKIDKLDYYIEELEKDNNIVYNEKQKEAIKNAIANNIFIITGGPGTGKTTIIKAIIEIYKKINNIKDSNIDKAITLLAPTGRAAKKMSESANIKASTIHRFLKWQKETDSFLLNEYNKSESKLIIVDECSMIDIELMSHLVKALIDDINLVLVGDFNQLPSVGPGQVLKDLIESDVVPKIELDHLYRQDENSYITELAYEIKENSLTDFLKPKNDYQFLECHTTSIVPSIKNICTKILEKGYDYKTLQIMAPMYKGIAGIDILNKELQEIFNPKSAFKNEINLENVIYRENDKVLQLENNPDDNVFNGDIGIITNIIKNTKDKKTEIYIDFDGNKVIYTQKDLYKIRHGYVISIHKSQGSEFDFVIIPVSHIYHRMLYRKLIYTAVTRAKKKLILIGEPYSFVASVNNNSEYIRKTHLKEKLVQICINL